MAYRKIEDGKLTAIADAIRSQLDATVTMNLDEMPGLIGDIGIGYIPDYWRSYLDDKVTEIDTALAAAVDNRSAFLWYTDAHWVDNYGRSPMLLKYLSKHTGMKKTFFGGDIAQATSGEIDTLTAWRELVADVPNHRSVIGNHDNAVTDLADAAARADFFLLHNGTEDMAGGTDATNGKMYYYVDSQVEKTRYICLSTGRMWTTTDEIPWCIDALNSTPSGWHIVAIGHLWLNNDYSDDGATLNTTPPDYSQSYLDLFDAYNHRLTGTTSYGSVAYDFTGGQAKIEFVIGGHTHQDYDFATTKGIPVILTECDGYDERDDNSAATQGTTTENCVYAIVADYTAKQVNIINVGRGNTRNLAIPDVVTYTNQLPIATNTDGGIYNDIGYKTSTRISVSSGSFEERTESGWCTSGLIPATGNDVVRLKNCTFTASTTASTHRGSFYGANADGSYSGEQVAMADIAKDGSACEPVFDEDGDNIIQFKIPSYITTPYIRIVVQEFTENSILTVNEEIG